MLLLLPSLLAALLGTAAALRAEGGVDLEREATADLLEPNGPSVVDGQFRLHLPGGGLHTADARLNDTHVVFVDKETEVPLISLWLDSVQFSVVRRLIEDNLMSSGIMDVFSRQGKNSSCCRCNGNKYSWSWQGECRQHCKGSVVMVNAPPECRKSVHEKVIFKDYRTCTDTCERVFKDAEQTHDQCVYVTGCPAKSCDFLGAEGIWACSNKPNGLELLQKEVNLAFRRGFTQREPMLMALIKKAISHILEHPARPSMDAFSPLVCQQPKAFSAGLSAAYKDFSGGLRPYKAGKNSGSGASFFYSNSGDHILKKVRDFEYAELWKLSEPVCRSSNHSDRSTSLLCTIVLGFTNRIDNEHWLIMVAEKLPEEVEKVLPSKSAPWRQNFFADLKPTPLKNDLDEFLDTLTEREAQHGLQMDWWDGWQAIQAQLHADLGLLAEHDLVDYSLLLHGAFVDYDAHHEESKEYFAGPGPQSLQEAGARQKGCASGCAYRQRRLVDVTSRVDNKTRTVLHGTQKYKCCCPQIEPGESSFIMSPCALVNTASAPKKKFGDVNGCKNLLGDRFHSYHRTEALPHLRGRCLLSLKVFSNAETFYDAKNGARTALYLPPEELDGVVISQPSTLAPSCGVICVRVIDYLLPLHGANKVENVVLAPFYGQRKWSNYAQRTAKLLMCLGWGRSPVATVPTRRYAAQLKDDVYLFFMGWDHWSSLPNSCIDVFGDSDASSISRLDADRIESMISERL